ncbi:MAG TPA: peptidoglycan DD-metalloendopeptidase family protein [Gemmatimonas sp.]|nr:peptidoglycan DD-metalloendopeptidase family protein [Gemmatimonas sp.]
MTTACNPRDALDRMREPSSTPHERYAELLRDAGLDTTALGREWLAAADSALRSPLLATLPAREIGVYSRSEARAIAYQFTLPEGARLRVTFQPEGQPARVYIDLFEVSADSTQPYRHRASGEPENPAGTQGAAASAVPADSARPALARAVPPVVLAYESRATARFVLRLQPELLRSGKYVLELRTEPMLAFPVQDGTNRSIQSFFGAVRDGGRRDHQGIDIFAPRGTPVLASTDGIVRSIAPNRLGGNVVWLSDPVRGQSLYYAHLDRHFVAAGERVSTGDTLGFVGNSGNAATTAPHLHFGIYRRGEGPIDPLPYVRRTVNTPAAVRVDTSVLRGVAFGRGADASLRRGPGNSYDETSRIASTDTLHIMGAAGTWYRVQSGSGATGYLPSAALRPSAERRQ